VLADQAVTAVKVVNDQITDAVIMRRPLCHMRADARSSGRSFNLIMSL
jgi:hypothetical protein